MCAKLPMKGSSIYAKDTHTSARARARKKKENIIVNEYNVLFYNQYKKEDT
jgi:hypothetical protein